MANEISINSRSSLDQAGHSYSLLTVHELSGRLNVPVSWIYTRTRHNQIPCVRVGKYLRFDLHEIDVWARSGGAEVSQRGAS